MLDLHGKNILITGGSSGIGRATAQLAAELGANVWLVARNAERLQATLSTLPSGDHHFSIGDLMQPEAAEQVSTSVREHWTQVDGMVYASGVDMTQSFRNTTPQSIAGMFQLHVASGIELVRQLLRNRLFPTTGASIVYISSVMGKLGQPGRTAYATAKAAILGTVRCLAIEFAAKKIRANAVLPGIVETELTQRMWQEYPAEAIDAIRSQHPLGFGTPEDVAQLCVFLLSDWSRWITGSEIIIDGGYSIQ